MSDWITEIASEIPIESLPDELQPVVDSIGMENTLRVIEKLGGVSVYFPKFENLVKPVRDNHIRNEFTGSNHRALARKYNLTESWIRCILQSCKSHLKRS